jgi:hypothetical protein
MKSNINSVELHPQLSNNGHPVGGALVGAGSLWPPSNVHSQTVLTSVKNYFSCQKDPQIFRGRLFQVSTSANVIWMLPEKMSYTFELLWLPQ